ncbi:MAG: hypothetical protein HeimC3_55240 [Candidatus Heimdallarchaeota archaeon LC_3]|nr:MAG: hypothetical protein HeimC3_55240 [Candidatus Heimdallarchaeota archaeon LC_3]
MYVGNSDNMRKTIKTTNYRQWLKLNTLNDAHRSNYIFDSPNGFIHPFYAEVKHIFLDCDIMEKRPDRALNDHFEEQGDIRRAFISSGNNFHLLLEIEQIPARFAKVTINSYVSNLSLMTGIQFDLISSDLTHLRRAVGTINPKSNKMACYYDPNTFETSLEPIILGENTLEIPIIRSDIKSHWEKLHNKKLFRINKRKGLTDPYDMNIRLPNDTGHFSRIKVLRQLRNGGVSKEKSLEFIRSWLTPEKFEHMVDEGVIDRIFNYRL